MARIPYEVPLTPAPQAFDVPLGGTAYRLTVVWNNAPTGGWVLDIALADGTEVINGIPLITGANLLAQYEYLGIPGTIEVQTEGNLDAVPTFENLGVQSHLFFIVDDGT